MATIASASSSTFTSIMSTLTTVARTAERTITTAASGLDMLDTYVESARIRQADKHKIDMALYRENLLQDASLEQARREKVLYQELKDAELNSHFQRNYQNLSALFAHPEASQ